MIAEVPQLPNDPAALREWIRRGEYAGPTSGLARGYVQANLVILPADWAEEFAEFCRANPKACPSLDQTQRGNPSPRRAARGADLRTDVPRYRVFLDGQPLPEEPTDVLDLWRDDLVGLLLGCSFTFEAALLHAGLRVRHIDQGRNVPMYRTNRPCRSAGRFAGPLVVSMRPFAPDEVERAARITSAYPRMHGGPVHAGDPAALGIDDLSRPDFGDPVTLHPGEVPVFWACGVTSQVALQAARPPLAITHSPGCMFIADWTDEEFFDPDARPAPAR